MGAAATRGELESGAPPSGNSKASRTRQYSLAQTLGPIKGRCRRSERRHVQGG